MFHNNNAPVASLHHQNDNDNDNETLTTQQPQHLLQRRNKKHVSWACDSDYKQVYVVVQDEDDIDAAWYCSRDLRSFKRDCRRSCQWVKQQQHQQQQVLCTRNDQSSSSSSSSASLFSERGLEHFIHSDRRIRRRTHMKESIQAVLRGQAAAVATSSFSAKSQEQEQQQVTEFHLRISTIYQTHGAYSAQQDALNFGRMDALVAQHIHNATTTVQEQEHDQDHQEPPRERQLLSSSQRPNKLLVSLSSSSSSQATVLLQVQSAAVTTTLMTTQKNLAAIAFQQQQLQQGFTKIMTSSSSSSSSYYELLRLIVGTMFVFATRIFLLPLCTTARWYR